MRSRSDGSPLCAIITGVMSTPDVSTRFTGEIDIHSQRPANGWQPVPSTQSELNRSGNCRFPCATVWNGIVPSYTPY